MSEDRGANYQSSQFSITLQFQSLMQPEIQSYISRLKSRYKRYHMSLEDGRKIIDRAMGNRTLSEMLHQIRQETA